MGVPAYEKAKRDEAIESVKTGKLSLLESSTKYNIPYKTLHNHLKGRRGVKRSSGFGRATIFSEELELTLAENIKVMTKWGFGLTKSEFLDVVQQFVEKNNMETPFKNGRPGTKWFLRFKLKHGLSLKQPQSVEYARKKILDPFIIYEYFDMLTEVMTKYDLLDKPAQIYNLDESSFCSDPTKDKVLGAVNEPCSRTTYGTGKENTTVLFACSAFGQKMPPLIVFKAKNVWDTWVAENDIQNSDEKQEAIFPDMTYAPTKNGWMETETFLKYLETSFIPNAVTARPLLLIYDGHSTHINDRVIELAVKNDIIILKLPPHSSHLLQPLDVAVFKGLKTRWEKSVGKWTRNNQGRRLPKSKFSKFISHIWTDAPEQNIRAGFKKSGIVPVDRNVIKPKDFQPAVWRRYVAFKATEGVVVQEHNIHTNAENTFEELLLETVKQHKAPVKQKKTRLIKGAEIITQRKVNCEIPSCLKQEKDDEIVLESAVSPNAAIVVKKKTQGLKRGRKRTPVAQCARAIKKEKDNVPATGQYNSPFFYLDTNFNSYSSAIYRQRRKPAPPG
jgi:DDE superfamily endonuclease/helix-turn-helix, Psq domain